MQMLGRPLATFLLASAVVLALALPAQAKQRTLFAVQQLGAVGITTFSLDTDTGALVQQPGVNTDLALPTVPSISPDGRNLFVADFNTGLAKNFEAVASGPVPIGGGSAPTGVGPNAAIIDPSGGFLWSADYNGGSVSGIGVAGGQLAALGGFPIAVGGTPTTVAVSPRNRFLYLPTMSADSVAGYVRGADGSLTAIPGSPFAAGQDAIDAELSVDGTKLFVANQGDSSIGSYSVDPASGALASVALSPLVTAAAPTGLAATPNGRFLLAASQPSDTLTSYSIAGDGSLAVVDSAPTGSAPGDATITPDGRFAYTTNYWSGTISGYAIAADGTLSQLAGSPFGDGSGAVASFAITPNQGPTASFGAAVDQLSVNFDASASSDADGSVATWAWDFGDGQSASGPSASAAHTYAAAGTYQVTLTATDDEGCSELQIGTGQTLYCNGGGAAKATRSVTIPPLTLTRATGKQARSRRNGRKVTRRLRTRFTLSGKANVKFRFQKSAQRGTCRRARIAARHRIRFRPHGRAVVRPARAGSNQRTFARTLGGRRITPGRYRVRMTAVNRSGQSSGLVVTKSFCIR